MVRIGVSITKSTTFRNSTQEFSNVYYFEGNLGLPTAAEADTLLDQLKGIEVGFHSSSVSFVRGRLWSAGGTKAENEMISQKQFTGTGSTTTNGSMDKERAFLIQARAGSDSRGKPVYLRKWYHSCGNGPGGQVVQTNQLQQTGGFSTTEQNAIGTAVGNISPIGTGGKSYVICSKQGRGLSGGVGWKGHPFLEHHQFGDQWRSQ
jgi:hypothetical protein